MNVMTTKRAGVWLALSTMALAPLGCEAGSSLGGAPTNDSRPYVATDSGDPDPQVPSQCVAPTGEPTMHAGSISADETWTAAASPHVLPYDTTIYKRVTLEPCAEVLVAKGRSILVRDGGALLAEGTAAKRIHIGAKDSAAPWAQIRSYGKALRFAYTTIDGGGMPGNTAVYSQGTIDVQGDTQQPTQELLFVDHVTVAGSSSTGIVLRDGAGFMTGSMALVVKGAASFPLNVWGRSLSGVPDGVYTGNGIDQVLIPATSGNETISEDTTIHDRGIPYLVGHATSAGDLRVDVGPGKAPVTLTIEAGVTMRFKKAGTLQIAVASGTNPARGSLVAVGTVDRPIVFTSNEASPAAGDWLGLSFGEIPTTHNKLDNVRVEYAGGASASGSGSCPDNEEFQNNAAIRIKGWPTSQFITNTWIIGSATNGVDRGWRDDRAKIDFLSTVTFDGVARCNQTYPPNAANVCPAPADVPCPVSP